MNVVIAYILTLVVFAVVDTAWLGTMGDRVYRPLIGSMLAENFRLIPAVVFYAIYALGLTIFAVLPALASGQWKTALIWGAAFGFFAYATYDLTNLATLRSWSVRMVAMDIAWGTFVSGASATGGYWLATRAIRALA
ncbi:MULTISPECIES: DUF2177 family protein [unclassified Brevundimonas]|uniref:DUF2177 family protein n=1 Tax=unclassified Brevundimonas TaxID=2622653 RepID=UPI0025C71E44|nr:MULTISPECIES: DUF2177 family protein [unclassified Brevundimonas]